MDLDVELALYRAANVVDELVQHVRPLPYTDPLRNAITAAELAIHEAIRAFTTTGDVTDADPASRKRPSRSPQNPNSPTRRA